MYEPMTLHDLEVDRKAIKVAIDKACEGEHPLAVKRALLDKLEDLAKAEASARMRIDSLVEGGIAEIDAAIAEATNKKH